jgi:two-component system invasion response regulator UvrY
MESIRVVMIDDQDFFRIGIRALLGDDITLLDSFADVESCCQHPASRRADVIILDDTLPGIETLDAVQRIKAVCPQTALLVLGSRLRLLQMQDLQRAGVLGFVCKDDLLQDALPTGIRRVYAGYPYLSPEAVVIRLRQDHAEPLEAHLVEVLELIKKGLTSAQIAHVLSIHPRTAYNRRTELHAALGVLTDAQAVAEAIRRGLLSEDG